MNGEISWCNPLDLTALPLIKWSLWGIYYAEALLMGVQSCDICYLFSPVGLIVAYLSTDFLEILYHLLSLLFLYIEGILPKGPYLPCVSMAGRALFAGFPRYVNSMVSAILLCGATILWWHASHSARGQYATIFHSLAITACAKFYLDLIIIFGNRNLNLVLDTSLFNIHLIEPFLMSNQSSSKLKLEAKSSANTFSFVLHY